MIKPDFQKIIYRTDEFHRLPWFKVYDFLKLPEFHILLRACPPKYEPVHILYFSNGHFSYIPLPSDYFKKIDHSHQNANSV